MRLLALASALGFVAVCSAALASSPRVDDAAPAPLGEVSVAGYTRVDATPKHLRRDRMAALHAELLADAADRPKAADVQVALNAAERAAIGESPAAGPQPQPRRVQVGVGKALDLAVDLSAAAGRRGAFAHGWLAPRSDGGFAWTAALHSPGAHGLRVMFAGLDLPPQAALYVFNARGEAFGPYAGRGMDGSGELVSHSVTGDTVMVQLRVAGALPRADAAQLRFALAELGHLGPRFQLARRVNAALDRDKAFCSYNVSCVVNGECASGLAALEDVRRAVAHMLFRSGGSYYICSGGLINNSRNDGRNLFLTANHCISSERSADSLEAFFDFRAASCADAGVCDLSYTQMRAQFPTTLGADLLAADSAGDYSLMELAQTPEGTRHYLGFSTAALAGSDGAALYRMSHPSGAPQAWSRHAVDANSFTCTTLPRGRFIYSQDTGVGATEGGSSGSPVLNGAAQIVGQLYGACGTNLDDECDTEGNRTVDGALAFYYPDLATWLDPSGGGGETRAVHVAAIALSVAPSGRNKFVGSAAVSVVDADGAAVAGATVNGEFRFGNKRQNANGVTGAGGVATLQSGANNQSSFSFCVTGISGDGLSWNAADDVETCDAH